uniref:Uncharacterized protein n=1 Tax=viral metagenome TaxID=1070528 RepID=A0A6C0J419_9ZZZZ
MLAKSTTSNDFSSLFPVLMDVDKKAPIAPKIAALEALYTVLFAQNF